MISKGIFLHTLLESCFFLNPIQTSFIIWTLVNYFIFFQKRTDERSTHLVIGIGGMPIYFCNIFTENLLYWNWWWKTLRHYFGATKFSICLVLFVFFLILLLSTPSKLLNVRLNEVVYCASDRGKWGQLIHEWMDWYWGYNDSVSMRLKERRIEKKKDKL